MREEDVNTSVGWGRKWGCECTLLCWVKRVRMRDGDWETQVSSWSRRFFLSSHLDEWEFLFIWGGCKIILCIASPGFFLLPQLKSFGNNIYLWYLFHEKWEKKIWPLWYCFFIYVTVLFIFLFFVFMGYSFIFALLEVLE